MVSSRVVQEVLDAVKPPDGWEDTQTNGVLALLLGSLAALLQCRSILNSLNGVEEAQWVPEESYEEFRIALEGSDLIDWKHSASVGIWSAGFFLNKAQSNIAAALDKCVNAWLAHELGLEIQPKPESGQGDEGLFYPYITVRLRIISQLCRKEMREAFDLLEKLCKGFQKFGVTHAAREEVKRYSEHLRDQEYCPPFDQFYDEFKVIAITPTESVAIVFSRVNSFKHEVYAEPERKKTETIIESVITTNALICVARLWKLFVERKKTPTIW